MSSKETIGRVVDGKYRIENQLGKGGMGTVYLATHIGTGRPVAIKVIVPQFMQRPEFVERFRREAKAAGRLRHPNVVDVTDFGFSVDEDGTKTAYLVMEYLDGCTLGEVLDEEKTIPLEFTVEILEQVCSAVDEAHRQGIIHRDLKPDNIWLEPNQRGGYTVKVLDFGIAKLEETQFEQAIENPDLVRDISKSRLSDGKGTSLENTVQSTNPGEDQSTIAGEGGTMAIGTEGETIIDKDSSEAGTIIQNAKDETDARKISEAGTVIQQVPEEKPVDRSEADTIHSSIEPVSPTEARDGKSTNVISAVGGTDDNDLDSNTPDLTKVGAVLGTPLYMSPEQCRGEKLTQASDIYSLSVIVYQMLSGKLPFNGDYVEVMNGHKNEAPPKLKARKVPDRLKGVVMRALSKDASERPETAQALASKLRANSEGLGVLLRRSVVIYSERLPKFLLVALITFLPVVLVTFMRVGFSLLYSIDVIKSDVIHEISSAVLGIFAFFLQIVAAAILVGTTTWVVGQVLAFPLRPISVRAAFKEVGKRWKPLTVTVTLSTLLALFGWLAGAFAGVFGFVHLIGVFALSFGKGAAFITAAVGGGLGMVILGTLLTGLFMLIAPAIMMEGVSGKAAFRRSLELTRRALRTVLATTFLVYIVPALLALAIGLSVGSVINNFEMKREMKKMEEEGVVAQKQTDKNSKTITISTTGAITETKKSKDGKNIEEDMATRFSKTLQEGIFELLWTPLALLISSFTSVITALIYFKTRQAGGESMQGLLGKLDNADRPQTKWQQRVRKRLIQSGRVVDSQSDPQV